MYLQSLYQTICVKLLLCTFVIFCDLVEQQSYVLPAVRAEGWLLKVDCHELVAIDLMDPPPQGSAPLGVAETATLLKLGRLHTHTTHGPGLW